MITHSCVCLEARSWAPICLTALLFRTSLSMAWCLRSATWWWIQWFKASQQFVTTIAVWNEREGRIDTTKCILHFGVVCFHICFQLLRLMARRWANGWRTIQIPRSLELINFFALMGDVQAHIQCFNHTEVSGTCYMEHRMERNHMQSWCQDLVSCCLPLV